MKYCYECSEELEEKYLEGEGMIPYCKKCGCFRFPIFSSAVSMVVHEPRERRILLIQQYGRTDNILVAGYINKGECAEEAAAREVREETGLEITGLSFNRSEYFAKSNTLMMNFACEVHSTDLSEVNGKEIDRAQWFSYEDALKYIKPGSLAKKFLEDFLRKQGIIR